MILFVLQLLVSLVVADKCDQTPPLVTTQPVENEAFEMTVQNQGKDANGSFVPDQRYVISLIAKDELRPFRMFMITAEDPNIDSMEYDVERNPKDVGQLKTLVNDQRSRYSERCHNTVENIDYSEKDKIEVVSLIAKDELRPFRMFMITAEDPNIDSMEYDVERNPKDVGQLKTLVNDQRSRYSERCHNTVENIDYSEKDKIEIHWLSPKGNLLHPEQVAQKVRIRAMIAENSEVWYTGPNLDFTLARDDSQPLDAPKFAATETCDLCSEARYEITFKGLWSRLTHEQHFPKKLDNNAYSHMVGASHGFDYVLWQPNVLASNGLKKAAESSNMTDLENEIIEAMSNTDKTSTRTLIRGRRNAHPNMFNASHALFRVDRVHHLFSVVIAIRPSPDWFLGAFKFELCGKDGWLDYFQLPLYPWDAGTMDGVSYETPPKQSSPQEYVGRVALGSFDHESPFFQINLNDLKPFGHLIINLLDEYPLQTAECFENNFAEDAEGNEGTIEQENEEAASLEEQDEDEGPQLSESREGCGFSPWSSWTPCVPDGVCGPGHQIRTRLRMQLNPYFGDPSLSHDEMCIADHTKKDSEHKYCYSECY